MKELLITMIAMSSVDSLNPIGITQQFILQGMVKKPRHIWYFILTTGVVNMIFGYLVYYGAMTLINREINNFIEKYSFILYMLEMAVGLLLIVFSCKKIVKKLKGHKKGPDADNQTGEEEKIRSKVRSVAPLALIAVGIVSTASELTSAVPYFSFLAVFVNYQLSFGVVTAILIFYNIIYMLPFMILYFVYIISQNWFNKIYDFFKQRFKNLLEICIPILFFVLGFVVLFDSILKLI